MRQIISQIALIFALTLAAPVVQAGEAGGDEPTDPGVEQTATESDTESTNFDQAHRRQIYESSRLQPWRAVAYSAALPGLGNFYAEQYALGTVALGAMVFTGMFLAFGAMYGHPDLIRIGAVTGATAYLGSGISSYLGARHYNQVLKQSLHVNDQEASLQRPGERSWTVGFEWRF